ncbi:MAG: YncE family protein [Terriglobia bacterium]
MTLRWVIRIFYSIPSGLSRALGSTARIRHGRSIRRGPVWLGAGLGCAGLLGMIPLPAQAQGSGPYSVVVNAVTNKIYVANYNSDNVTVMDGATNATTIVDAGRAPDSVAVNPVTNKIYIANYGGGVTVVDGATNATTTVVAGLRPFSVAVDPVTNKIYVANRGFTGRLRSNTVTVIDGATNATRSVAAGYGPFAVAVNPVTNNIYVANLDSNTVTVIDGATNAATTVAAVAEPEAVAVNPVTNKIYVANRFSGKVTVIDGATNATKTVGVGSGPDSIAVNPVTNRIYVANFDDNNVTVIDGVTNATQTIGVGSGPFSVAVNPATNEIFVANRNSNTVTMIDGATNATKTLATGLGPDSVAVNSATNRIYVANFNNNNVTVIDGASGNATTMNGKLPFKAEAATVLHLSKGPNRVDLQGDGLKRDVIFMAYRENFNAHSFWVVTVYMGGGDIVPWFDKSGNEHDEIETRYGGADCVLDDMRLVRVGEGKNAQFFLVQGERALGKSFADTQPVSFDVYRLTGNNEGITGRPPSYFDYVTTIQGTGKYCDINEAFKAELKLGDYVNWGSVPAH